MVECSCCFSEAAWDETSALECGHRFCDECWSGSISSMKKRFIYFTSPFFLCYVSLFLIFLIRRYAEHLLLGDTLQPLHVHAEGLPPGHPRSAGRQEYEQGPMAPLLQHARQGFYGCMKKLEISFILGRFFRNFSTLSFFLPFFSFST
jgi:hypothetical protein